MTYKIEASNLLTRRYMRFDAGSVAVTSSSVVSDEAVFAYGEIDAILLSATGLLSFQAGQRTFSIQTKLDDAKHQEAIKAFVDYVAKAAAPIGLNSVNNT